MIAAEIQSLLHLEPLEPEGGFWKRTYSAPHSLDTPQGRRLASSAIYYLLAPGTFSEMHRMASDEIFHFYQGDPVEMLQLYPDGRSAHFILGPDLSHGQHVQLLVPAGVWQGCHLVEDGEAALMGCTVCPGFEYEDYQGGVFSELAAQWPHEAESIRALTRQ